MSENNMKSTNKNILIACTGSVASLRLPLLIKSLLELNKNICIKVIVTNHAMHFFNKDDIPKDIPILKDEDEWLAWQNRGDPVLHIDLGKWADLLVIAPLDANTLAKLANGLCDNLITCVARAWPLKQKPAIYAPSMNTFMWEHPITSQHTKILQNWGWEEIACISKKLMCGDTGMGAMAEVPMIIQSLLKHIQ